MQPLKQILGELAGASSLCWKPEPTGVFDAEKALKFVDEAASQILPGSFLKQRLIEDDGYLDAWRANLEMAFIDEGCDREIAKRGAKRFLSWIMT